MYCLLDMLDSENTAKLNWRAKQPSQMVCILEDLEVLKRLRHHLPAQSQRQLSVDRLEEQLGVLRPVNQWGYIRESACRREA